MRRAFLLQLILFLFFAAGTASAHTPDWASHLLEKIFGKKAAVDNAPSAGWIKPRPVRGFRLMDQDGRQVSLQDLQGKVVLMNFMYSGCGDACSSLKEMRVLATALGKKMGQDVIFASITLSPEWDAPETLKVFAQEQGIGRGWKLLTGSSAAIDELVEDYGVYVKRTEANPQISQRVIEYGDVILFLDQQGRLRKRILPHLLQLSGRPDVEWLLEKQHHN